jgi:hypothetical protein
MPTQSSATATLRRIASYYQGDGCAMFDLLIRTISQGLQAFLPVAAAWVWFRRAGRSDAVDGLKVSARAAIPATVVATHLFQQTNRQALWEAALAAGALLLAIWFARAVWRGVPAADPAATAPSSAFRLTVAAGATLIVVRQTMEIGVPFAASLQLRAAEPLLAVTGGVVIAISLGAVWLAIGPGLRNSAVEKATRVFAVLFGAQAAMYLLHESAEAQLLPWSEILHAATEPYGPDGIYGQYISVLLFLVPVAVAAAAPSFAKATAGKRPDDAERSDTATPMPTVLARIGFGIAVLLMAGIQLISVATREASDSSLPAAKHELAAIAGAPHLVFRHTAADPNYGRLSLAPLDGADSRHRAAAALGCRRIGYAGGRGICLAADRGLFTTYSIVFFDGALTTTATAKLQGSPSRTRVSPDGRVGAVTVFALGSPHDYKDAAFSTRTTIHDMATGTELGELEQFTTWRDGKRIKSVDFNFWGVTFARDSNIFYATLRTAGTTYLVRGDLALRSLTVVRDNVECPALSPDNRLVAFKKRIGPPDAPWRLYVLDLATLTEQPITAETRSIDDQLEWLDDGHVLYGAPSANRPSSHDVWVAPLNGGAARIFLPDAESPIVVR